MNLLFCMCHLLAIKHFPLVPLQSHVQSIGGQFWLHMITLVLPGEVFKACASHKHVGPCYMSVHVV